MRKYLMMLWLGVMAEVAYAQSLPTPALFFDETTLTADVGTTLMSDPIANKGNCLYRSSTTNAGTMWYGPYISIAGGNYLVSFRLKVANNTSSLPIITLDVSGSAGGSVYKSLDIKPNMFKASNQWQVFTFSFSVNNGASGIELRGISFQPGVTDLYFDYAAITTGDIAGQYDETLTISPDGKIGMGTIQPKEKLSVNGKIRAKEIKVEAANWPDYVFEEGYAVGKLEALESYIKANKHLPEIPSAKDIETDGVALGEMNKLLLKKIEELTLYVIDLKKENQEIKKHLKLKP